MMLPGERLYNFQLNFSRRHIEERLASSFQYRMQPICILSENDNLPFTAVDLGFQSNQGLSSCILLIEAQGVIRITSNQRHFKSQF
jgi:hypothetical protein